MKTIEQGYKKAPFYAQIIQIIHEIINSNENQFSKVIELNLRLICEYLEIKTEMISSSSIYQNTDKKAQERILDICKQEKASHYINLIGGLELYDKEAFAKQNMQMNFIKTLPIEYKQFKNEFVPWLSMIDVLMFNSKEEINELLNRFELV
jgi:hypothetical protein